MGAFPLRRNLPIIRLDYSPYTIDISALIDECFSWDKPFQLRGNQMCLTDATDLVDFNSQSVTKEKLKELKNKMEARKKFMEAKIKDIDRALKKVNQHLSD